MRAEILVVGTEISLCVIAEHEKDKTLLFLAQKEWKGFRLYMFGQETDGHSQDKAALPTRLYLARNKEFQAPTKKRTAKDPNEGDR